MMINKKRSYLRSGGALKVVLLLMSFFFMATLLVSCSNGDASLKAAGKGKNFSGTSTDLPGTVIGVVGVANSAKAFTAFSFTSALNSGAGVTSDVTGAISGGSISLTVPYGTTLTGLKATFSTTGASVVVGSIVRPVGLPPMISPLL